MKPRKLSNIETQEVSLVKRGAVRTRFLLRKKDETMPLNTIPDVVTEALETATPVEKSVMPSLRKMGLSKNAQTAVQSALRILSAVQDELPHDFESQLSDMLGESSTSVTKSMDQLPPKLRVQVEKLLEDQDSIRRQNTQIRKDLDAERALRVVTQYASTVAKRWPALPIKPQRLGSILYQVEKTLAKADMDELTRVLSAGNNALHAELQKTQEHVAASDDLLDGSTVDIVRKRATMLAQESDISIGDAVAKLLNDDEALYEQYVKETQQKV